MTGAPQDLGQSYYSYGVHASDGLRPSFKKEDIGGHRWVVPSTGGRRGLVIHSFMHSDRHLQKSLEGLVPVRIIWWGWFIWLLAMGKVIPDEYCYEGPRIRFVHPQILAVLRKWVRDEGAGRGYGDNYQIKKVHIRWLQGARCQGQKNLSPNWSREIQISSFFPF